MVEGESECIVVRNLIDQFISKRRRSFPISLLIAERRLQIRKVEIIH